LNSCAKSTQGHMKKIVGLNTQVPLYCTVPWLQVNRISGLPNVSAVLAD
jgi:hypothetical protein